MQTYLVEHYRPGLDAEALRDVARAVRAAAAALTVEGEEVRYVLSTIVPGDEALLSLFEAESEDVVRRAYARARVPFERISPALPEEPACARAHDERRAR